MNNNFSNSIIKKEVFEEYKSKEQLKTISLLKSIILGITLINIAIIIFIIMLYHQITLVKQTNVLTSNNMTSKEGINNDKVKSINQKLVSMHTSNEIFNKEFTNIIRTEKEFNTLINWIDEEDGISLYVCYMHHRDSYLPLDICRNEPIQVFLIQTLSNNRFGALLKNYSTDKDELIDKRALLFNLDNQMIFPINDPRRAFNYRNNTYLISFGDDLVIDNDFLNKVSYSKFPSSYGSNKNSLEDLTGGEDYFNIQFLEIYSLIRKYN